MPQSLATCVWLPNPLEQWFSVAEYLITLFCLLEKPISSCGVAQPLLGAILPVSGKACLSGRVKAGQGFLADFPTAETWNYRREVHLKLKARG